MVEKTSSKRKASEKVTLASKTAKKNLYKSEHVYTEFGDEEIETESTKLKEDFLDLVESAKVGKILTGTITGLHYSGKTLKSTIMAEVAYGNGTFEVLIPSYLLFDYEIDRYVEPNKIQEIQNEIERRIGSKVRFIAVTVNEKAKTAVADRLEANAIVAHNNYVRPMKDGQPRIKKGMIVQGTVISTMSKGILVDCLGMDIYIKKDDLSWQFVGDARQEFGVGDTVNVRISDIEEYETERPNKKYKLVAGAGSVKDCIPDKRKELFKKYREDGIYSVTVNYRTASGIYCTLADGMDVLCAAPKSADDKPMRGDRRNIRITTKNEEELKIFGLFMFSDVKRRK